MPTNKVELRPIEQFMSDYTPRYQPIYPLFLDNSQSYPEQTGKLDFRRVQTVGDIRAHHITPKDTEIKQVAVTDAKKSFKKYFLANQFQISQLQDQQGTEETIARVLDEHQKQADELFLFGDGTSAGSVANNGLFYSDDSNYTLENSAQVAAVDRLFDLHAKILASATKANRTSGRKVLLMYGEDVLTQYNGLYKDAVKPFKSVLSEVLGSNYTPAELPSEITPAGVNGWIVANIDQIKTHYTVLPKLKDQGSNDEKMYNWFNFLMGSMMVEVLASNAIVHQPVTFEA